MAVVRRLVGMLIVLVLGGDGAVVAARLGDDPGPQPVSLVPTTTVAVTTLSTVDPVLFRERFDEGSAFHVDTDKSATSSIVDGEYHLKFANPADEYVGVPHERPEAAVIEATRDVLVEVDARSASRDPTDWFGPMCRSGDINGDVYLAQVRPEGSWRLMRATLAGAGSGQRYVKRVLAEGKVEGVSGVQPMPAPLHLSLQCRGDSPASLVLKVNGVYAGQASDPNGIGPGKAGFVGSSTTGEVAFDNLVVTALR